MRLTPVSNNTSLAILPKHLQCAVKIYMKYSNFLSVGLNHVSILCKQPNLKGKHTQGIMNCNKTSVFKLRVDLVTLT